MFSLFKVNSKSPSLCTLAYLFPHLDLLEFDKEFYDQKLTESKKLNRFEVQIDAAALDITIDKKWIMIDKPASCACLQYNITLVDPVLNINSVSNQLPIYKIYA